jgi:SAM-dependent methyltransferase
VGPAVDFLVKAANGGAALELGIGTGRIALPLAARGVSVQAIDISEAMVARLRTKPGGAEIPVTIGDFATTRVEGVFSVVYLVFNTIMNLTPSELDLMARLAAMRAREPWSGWRREPFTSESDTLVGVWEKA